MKVDDIVKNEKSKHLNPYLKSMCMQESYALYTALHNHYDDQVLKSIKSRLDGFFDQILFD